MRIGVHVSIAGRIDEAIDRAVALHCDTMQVFSRNPRGWKSKKLVAQEVKEFRRKKNDYDIKPILVHIPYLINLATPKDELWRLSIRSYIEDIKRTDALGAEYFITHLGAHTGSGEQAGLKRFCEGLNIVVKEARPKTMILLETCAGQGTSLGHKFEHIAYMLKNIKSGNIGVCWDTCHIYVAGYDIATKHGLERTIKEFDNIVGLGMLKAMHLNDAKGALGSHLDRHQHIGKGRIKESGFKRILRHPRLRYLPVIMETPKKGPKDDPVNIKTTKKLAGIK
jgi:deoxyribonuclease-4